MGGNGTIGGGGKSCHLKFNINGKVTKRNDHATKPETFKVRVEFPNGQVVTDEVDKDNKIRFFWPVAKTKRRRKR